MKLFNLVMDSRTCKKTESNMSNICSVGKVFPKLKFRETRIMVDGKMR